jgi:hypothetical protein
MCGSWLRLFCMKMVHVWIDEALDLNHNETIWLIFHSYKNAHMVYFMRILEFLRNGRKL